MLQKLLFPAIFGGAALLVGALLIWSGGLAESDVEIGVVLPLSGADHAYGEAIRRGVELAYEDLAPDFKPPLTLTFLDSRSDPARAAELVAELYQRTPVVIGGATDAEAFAMVEVAERMERVLVSPAAASPALSGRSRSFYRVTPSARDEAVAMANFVRGSLELERMAIVVEAGPFGEGLAAALSEAFKGEIEPTLTLAPDDDPAAIRARLRQLNGGALYLAADGSELAQLVKVARAAGFGRGNGKYLLAPSALAHPAVLAEAEGAAERAYLTQTVFDPTSDEEPMRTFADHHQAKHGVMPDLFAAHGYDALLVVAEAVRHSGGRHAGEVRKGMQAIANFAGATGNLQFRETGDVQKYPRIYFVSGGRTHDYEAWRREKLDAWQDIQDRIRKQSRDLERGGTAPTT